MAKKEAPIVDSKVFSLKGLFSDKFTVDFFQREYVWERKQLEDLIIDLSGEFLKNWEPGHTLLEVAGYNPYFMGEIVLSVKSGEKSAVIDGQQRITTLTLLLIYLLRTYGSLPKFPNDISDMIYSDYYGEKLFNLDIPDRRECMQALFDTGSYIPPQGASPSVTNIVNRYADIADCWDKRIDESNVVPFVYWLKEHVMFSKVWTNSDEFAYVIFETMNDRGLSLTQIEMLRSYLLANIDENARDAAMKEFDGMVRDLASMNQSAKSKCEFDFFKMYLRGHYAEDLSQSKNANSDFTRIGKEFHRWVSENSAKLGLRKSEDYVAFLHRMSFFAGVYRKILTLTQQRDAKNYLYLTVNSDYGFTMQPAVIMAAVAYNDSDAVIENKIKNISRYLTKALTWRVWNHWMISQSAMEAKVYELCKSIRSMDPNILVDYLATDPLKSPELAGIPTLNQQNRNRFCVMLSLLTAIVAQRSGEPDYPLNKSDIQVEHIWSDHFEQHREDCTDAADFALTRNRIGDLLVLPGSFNASYSDKPYEEKVEQYFSQNILAQSLNAKKYVNNPGFLKYASESGLPFKAYAGFTRESISERTELYRLILEDNWKGQ